jgi:hypothetical protein
MQAARCSVASVTGDGRVVLEMTSPQVLCTTRETCEITPAGPQPNNAKQWPTDLRQVHSCSSGIKPQLTVLIKASHLAIGHSISTDHALGTDCERAAGTAPCDCGRLISQLTATMVELADAAVGYIRCYRQPHPDTKGPTAACA